MPARARILYVQPNSEIGGTDIALMRLLQTLDGDRIKPYVVLPRDGPMVERYLEAGAEVRFVEMRQLRTLPDPVYQSRYLIELWPTVLRLARVIEREKIDLVHTNSLYCLYGAWAALKTKRPHLWHIREIPPNVPGARRLYAAMVNALSVRIVAMTRACVQGLFGSAPASSKTELLADGLDLTKWSTSITGTRIRKELGIPARAPVVGFNARLDPWKGLEVFLRAAQLIHARIPQVRFIVSGGPPAGFEAHERQMRSLALQLGLRSQIYFTGWRYRLNDIPELMKAFTVFSHTSIRPEPFGLVVIEAMAANKPVVAAKAGGPMETVEDGVTGYLTPPGDFHANARAVVSLLDDSERIERFGRAGRQRVERIYSEKQFRQNLNRIYESIWRANELQ